jgi:PAS domain S-box-containing protein
MVNNNRIKLFVAVLVLFLLLGLGVIPHPSVAWTRDNMGEITVGIPANFPPQYSIDKKTGEPIGFAIDVMNEVADRSSLKVRYLVFDTWRKVMQAVEEGSVDVVPNTGFAEERKEIFDYTSPVETFQIRIFVRSSTSDIKNIEDLRGRRVSVVAHNKGLFLMKEQEHVELLTHPSLEEALMALLSGHCDALIYSGPLINRIARLSGVGNHIKAVGKPLYEVKQSIAVRKGLSALRNKLDDAVRALIHSPVYNRIYTKWYGKPKPFWDVTSWAAIMGILLALFIMGLTLWRFRSLFRISKVLSNRISRNRKTKEELRNKEREAALMAEASRILNSSLNIDHLFDEIAKLLSEEIGETGSILKIAGEQILPITSYREGVKDEQMIEIMNKHPIPQHGTVTGSCIKNKEPVLVEDTTNNQKFMVLYKRLTNITSYLCAPLIVKGEVLGVMSSAIYNGNRRFDINDLKVVASIAERAANALENSILYEEARIQAQRLSVVNEISRAVNSSLDLESVYQTIVVQLKRVLPFVFTMNIALYNSEDNTFLFSHNNDPTGVLHDLIKIDRHYQGNSLILKKAFKTQKIHYVKDATDETRQVNGCRKQFREKGIFSYLILPLIVEHKCIGTMNIGAFHRDAFSEEDRALLETISSHLAIALKNARSHEELEKSNREMAFMNSIMELFNNPHDISEVLNISLQKVIDFVSAEVGAIYLVDEKGEELQLMASATSPEDYVGKIPMLKIADSPLGLVVRTGKSQWGIDFSNDPCIKVSSIKEHHYKSYIIVPIRSKDRILGTISVISTREDIFTEDHLRLLEALGTQVGVAVENLNLYKMTIKTAKEWEATFNNVVDMIGIHDNNFNIITANRAYAAAAEKMPHEITGKTCYEVFHGAEEPCPNCPLKKTMDTGKTVMEEFFEPRLGKYLEVTASPIFDEEGEIDRFIHCIRDATERKQAEEKRRDSEEKYRALFEDSRDAVYVTSRTGDILDANQATSDLLGCTGEELMQLNILEMYINPADRDRFQREIEEKGFVKDYELRIRKKDGTAVHCLLTSTVRLAQNGEILGYQGIMRDITEKMIAEEELKRSREQLRNLSLYLQSAREDERKSIAREVHDELGQTLTALKMDLSWLQKRIPDSTEPLTEKIISMKKLIDMTIPSVKRIITALRPGLLDDLGLAAALEWQAQDFSDRTKVKCELTIDPVDISLEEDLSTAVFRIFQETLSNVGRHAEATRVEANLRVKTGALVLTIRDNGKGITEEEIFDRESFGLMGMRERIHEFGGEFDIKGYEGEGTRVKVSVPLKGRSLPADTKETLSKMNHNQPVGS